MMVSTSYVSYSYSNSNSSILTIHQTPHLMSDDESSSPKIKLIHVLSPFVFKNNDSIYYPLDRNQFATFASIERVQKRLKKNRIHLELGCGLCRLGRRPASTFPLALSTSRPGTIDQNGIS
jgi:hypothetical protein